MLQHLTDVVENGPRQSPGATYQEEAIDALMHGAELARDRRVNLMHVAQLYDEKVARPLPEPSGSEDRVEGRAARGSD